MLETGPKATIVVSMKVCEEPVLGSRGSLISLAAKLVYYKLCAGHQLPVWEAQGPCTP